MNPKDAIVTWRLLPLATFATTLALCGAFAPASEQAPPAFGQRFFPARPSDTALSTQDGILVRYEVGKLSGTLTLMTPQNGAVTFYLGEPVRIDGRQIACKAPSVEACRDWPVNVALGYTRVRVTYWHAYKPGSKDGVLATDEIRTLGTSAAVPLRNPATSAVARQR